MTLHELLGKLLAALKQGRLFCWTPARNAMLRTKVGQSLVLQQVAFLPSHTEINGMSLHPGYQFLQAISLHGLRDPGNGITSGEAEQLDLPR